MYSQLFGKELNEKSVKPLYFFYGEENFLAEQFISDVRQILHPEDSDFLWERFNLAETSWMTVLDTARTVPFFLTSRRIIIVDIPLGKADKLGKADRLGMEDFLSSPAQHTVCIFIVQGKIRKNSVLFKLFSSLPKTTLLIKELAPLKDRELFLWIDQILKSMGKKANPGTISRMVELFGNDLALLSNEIEKVAAYTGDKNVIETDDVNHMSGGMKSVGEYELSNALVERDYERCLVALNDQIVREGARPEMILGSVAYFFRDLLIAKQRLQIEKTDKKTIFAELRPSLKNRDFSNWSIFRNYFSLVERMTLKDLSIHLQELARIDLKNKTSDLSFQVMMEGFFFKYCGVRSAGSTLERGR